MSTYNNNTSFNTNVRLRWRNNKNTNVNLSEEVTKENMSTYNNYNRSSWLKTSVRCKWRSVKQILILNGMSFNLHTEFTSLCAARARTHAHTHTHITELTQYFSCIVSSLTEVQWIVNGKDRHPLVVKSNGKYNFSTPDKLYLNKILMWLKEKST